MINQEVIANVKNGWLIKYVILSEEKYDTGQILKIRLQLQVGNFNKIIRHIEGHFIYSYMTMALVHWLKITDT